MRSGAHRRWLDPHRPRSTNKTSRRWFRAARPLDSKRRRGGKLFLSFCLLLSLFFSLSRRLILIRRWHDEQIKSPIYWDHFGFATDSARGVGGWRNDLIKRARGFGDGIPQGMEMDCIWRRRRWRRRRSTSQFHCSLGDHSDQSHPIRTKEEKEKKKRWSRGRVKSPADLLLRPIENDRKKEDQRTNWFYYFSITLSPDVRVAGHGVRAGNSKRSHETGKNWWRLKCRTT